MCADKTPPGLTGAPRIKWAAETLTSPISSLGIVYTFMDPGLLFLI